MPIVIKCPACSKRYKLRDELAGKRVKCQCGHGMIVPSPTDAADSDEGTYGVAPATDADRISSLLDEDWSPGAEGPPSAAAGPPSGGRVLASPSGGSLQATGLSVTADDLAAEQLAKEEGARRSAAVPLALAILAGLVVVGGVVAVIIALALRPGFPSPEEAFAAHQEALGAKDWRAQLRTYCPASQEKILGTMASTALSVGASSPEIRQVFREHGVEKLLDAERSAESSAKRLAAPLTDAGEVDLAEWKKQMAELQKQMEERRKRVAAAVKGVSNKPAFYADLMAAIRAVEDKQLQNPLLKLMAGKGRADARKAQASGELTELKIDGDTAQGTISLDIGGFKSDSPVMFKRINGRWYIHIPEPEEVEGAPLGGSFGSPFGPGGL